MAVLKQKEVKTVRLVKKETTLPQDVWKDFYNTLMRIF